jgi:hypothetical protein
MREMDVSDEMTTDYRGEWKKTKKTNKLRQGQEEEIRSKVTKKLKSKAASTLIF